MIDALRQVARQARHAVLSGMRAAGGFTLVAGSTWRRRRLLIIGYHGVSLQDEHEWDPELFVTPAFLRRRFQILRDGGYAVLPLGEANRRLRDGTLPSRCVALTFDDGFYSFFAVVLPLLEEFGYPAASYVSTYYCLNQFPVMNLALPYMLWRARGQVLAPKLLPGQHSGVDLGDQEQREIIAAGLLREGEAISDDIQGRQAWLAVIAERLGVNWESIVKSRLFHLMTAEEVAEVARKGVDVQLHTHRHRTPHDKSAFRREVLENRRILENLTGRSAAHFCYPSGVVDSLFLPWLRDLGVETATTCEVGMAGVGHDPLLLPRYVDTMAQSEVQFESWLCGAGAILRGRAD